MERLEACIKLLGKLEHSCISFFLSVKLFSILPGNVYEGVFFSFFFVELTFERRVKGILTPSPITKAGLAAGAGHSGGAKPHEKLNGLMRKKSHASV